jgi:uncharacterized membrane protein YbhN (UPF0104 family)
MNYYLILIAVFLILLGYLLMTGPRNQGGDSFNYDIYSFRRITLAPFVLLSGYILVIISIMYTSKPGENNGKSRNGKI